MNCGRVQRVFGLGVDCSCAATGRRSFRSEPVVWLITLLVEEIANRRRRRRRKGGGNNFGCKSVKATVNVD